jgi:hypothetical protein
MATQNQKLDFMTRFQTALGTMFEAQQELIKLTAKAQLQGALTIDGAQMVGEFEGMTPEQWNASIGATLQLITGISPEQSAAIASIIK